MSAPLVSRMIKEIRMLQTEPPPGVWAAPKGDKVTELEAKLQGPKETVYEGGLFKLAVDIPARYPFEPPKVRFVTPIYHPNIDPEGRICLDILNMPPKGAWKPSLNVPTVLASLGLLLAEPNPDDGLVTDITAEFKHQRQVFDAKARQWTQQHAMQQGSGAAAAPELVVADGCASGGERAFGEAAAVAGHQQRQQKRQQGPPNAMAAHGAAAGAAAEGSSKENSQPGQQQAATGVEAVKQQDASLAAAAAAAAVQQPPKRPRLALRK